MASRMHYVSANRMGATLFSADSSSSCFIIMSTVNFSLNMEDSEFPKEAVMP